MLSPAEELARLDGEPAGVPAGLPVRVGIVAEHPGIVVERAREVLRAVVPLTATELDAEAELPHRLPVWFVEQCAPEPSAEESARWLGWWRSLGPEDRARAEADKAWTLADWLYWLTPGERQWFWWDAEIDSTGSAFVVVVVDGWPAPLGALRWLLRAAGADSVDLPD